jgi:mannosyl-3-phosphoglycerate synthase
MVRLRWASKPKRVPGTTRYVHVTEGRCSRVVNKWLSKLFASIRDEHQYHYTTVHGGAIKISPTTCSSAPVSGLVSTANAGEHAMTMGLALKLRMAAGYAVEPFHFVDLLERSGFAYYSGADLKESKGLLTDYAGEKRGSGAARPLNKPTRILQIRTLSPHFHRESDEGHIRRMWAVGLGAIYHNLVPVGYRAVSELREGMHKFAKESGGLDARTGKLPEPRIYRPLEEMNMERFRQMLGESLRDGTLRRFGFGRNMNGDEPICTCHT